MNLLSSIQLPYMCERGFSTSLTAEPVNTLTNIIFFLVAYKMFKLLEGHRIRDPKLQLLPLLTVLIGMGSTTFHTFHNPWSLILDALPIYLTILLFLFTFLVYTLRSYSYATLLTLLLLVIQAVLYVKGFQNVGNVSMRHLVNAISFPALLFLGFKKSGSVAMPLLVAFLFYVLAIGFRLLEPLVCPVFPIGTHLTWHIFNALVLYFGFKFLVRIQNHTPGV